MQAEGGLVSKGRAGGFLPLLPHAAGSVLIAGPICPLVPYPDARTPESQACEHSTCGQKGPACEAPILSPSPASQDCSIPSNMQKGEE